AAEPGRADSTRARAADRRPIVCRMRETSSGRKRESAGLAMKSEIRNPKSEIRNPKAEAGKPELLEAPGTQSDPACSAFGFRISDCAAKAASAGGDGEVEREEALALVALRAADADLGELLVQDVLAVGLRPHPPVDDALRRPVAAAVADVLAGETGAV